MSLKHAILVLLETEPSSGYDLLKHFNQSLGYFWNAKHQQVYKQLKDLHASGLISCEIQAQDGKPDKKIYAITEEGLEELKAWLAGQVKPNKINDGLLVKLYGGHLIPEDNLLNELLEHQKTHRRVLEELLTIEKTYLSLSPAKQEKYKLPYMTLRRGILGEKAWLEWADETLEALAGD